MKTSLPPPSSATWAERYESLRQHVLGAEELWPTRPLGLALWLARGMAGWMRQWTQATGTTSASAPLAVCSKPSEGWQRQLTLVLAQMAVGQLQRQGFP